MTLAPLLLHSTDVPPRAREALAAALNSAPDQRNVHLMRAARVIHSELSVDCADARELVGLPSGSC